MEAFVLSLGHQRRGFSGSPNDSRGNTERALDEFMQEKSHHRRNRSKQPRSVQQSIDPSLSPEAAPAAELWEPSADPSSPKKSEDSRIFLPRESVTYRPKRRILPNFKSQPFGKHQSYNAYQSMREQFLFDWDDWDRKRALRLRKPKSRRLKKMPVLKELPPISEHKVTAKLALKNFYLLKRKGFAQIAKEIPSDNSIL